MRAAILVLALAGTVPGGAIADPGIPRRSPELRDAVEATRVRALELVEEVRPDVERARAALPDPIARTLEHATGISPERAGAPRPRFVYFTSRSCEHADLALDLEVRRFLEAHPELDARVGYLGNPLELGGGRRGEALTDRPAAVEVHAVFLADVLARYRARSRDPAWMEVLRRRGRIVDTDVRFPVRMSTSEARDRGIEEVPAFVWTDGTRELVAVGRPGPGALEALHSRWMDGR